MLPAKQETSRKLDGSNPNIGKAICLYVEEIAQKNNLFEGKGDGSILVKSILGLIRLLPYYGYSAELVEVIKHPGTFTEVVLAIKDSSGKSVLQTEIHVSSEDSADYAIYVKNDLPSRWKLPTAKTR